MPVFIPGPPIDECTCAASPARNTRPCRYCSTCLSSQWNRDFQPTSSKPRSAFIARARTRAISSESTGSLSDTWCLRSHTIARYHQPSPSRRLYGAKNANSLDVLPSVSPPPVGPCANLTSASTIDDKIVLPGKSTPSNPRTVLCAPSAPIKYFARQQVWGPPSYGRVVTDTSSASCSRPTTSRPRRITAPCATA